MTRKQTPELRAYNAAIDCCIRPEQWGIVAHWFHILDKGGSIIDVTLSILRSEVVNAQTIGIKFLEKYQQAIGQEHLDIGV
jgi:hypothetical protein